MRTSSVTPASSAQRRTYLSSGSGAPAEQQHPRRLRRFGRQRYRQFVHHRVAVAEQAQLEQRGTRQARGRIEAKEPPSLPASPWRPRCRRDRAVRRARRRGSHATREHPGAAGRDVRGRVHRDEAVRAGRRREAEREPARGVAVAWAEA
jgi:hypothetical protein